MDVPYLGVIPARGGSKGIPRKNLEPVGGKPLLQWTIEAALGATRLDRVLLTSDDPEAIGLAERLGCPAPFVRPAELATDDVPTAEVALHALEWAQAHGDRVGSVVVLHPTSPFRDARDVDAAIGEFERSGRSTLLATVPVSQHPAECYRLDNGRLVPALDWPEGATGRQGLPAFFYDTGAIFVATANHLRTSRSLHDENAAVFLLEPSHGLEIDEPYQLELARGWINRLHAPDGLDGEVPLGDLPRWSPWPTRILGLDEWTTRERTRAKVEAEYDADKYASCLAYLSRNPGASLEDVRGFELGGDDETVCISRGGRLFACPLAEARRLYVELLADTMAPAISASASVVELGCGYGYNLAWLAERFPGPVYRGGDYSANAVEIAGALHGQRDDLTVERFDFYDTPYELFDGLPEPITVFTLHSLEQVPRSGPVIDALVALGSRIRSVFHFEPLHDPDDTSLLGLMRRRYDELNDYNRDLASELRACPDVRLLRLESGVLGLNPLHPVGVAHWEPAS